MTLQLHDDAGLSGPGGLSPIRLTDWLSRQGGIALQKYFVFLFTSSILKFVPLFYFLSNSNNNEIF